MDAKQLLAELSDDALRDRVTHLTERMRTQSGKARGKTYRQIARLLEVRRALSYARTMQRNTSALATDVQTWMRTRAVMRFPFEK